MHDARRLFCMHSGHLVSHHHHRLVVPLASDMDLDAVEQHGPIPVEEHNEDEWNEDSVGGKHMHPIRLTF